MLEGAVNFNMINRDYPMQMVCSFLLLSGQYEYGFNNENVVWMKLCYFKTSCLTNCPKMLNFANFEMGVNIFTV